ncbi:growth hormone secretagogue receptor type 1-like [Ptychodera flava]|uniref:growth hormone secretagogue receptor type 1-like n=1 Tax=Ptychodera flava TaxID=63121 RepID=UPI00396A1741
MTVPTHNTSYSSSALMLAGGGFPNTTAGASTQDFNPILNEGMETGHPEMSPIMVTGLPRKVASMIFAIANVTLENETQPPLEQQIGPPHFGYSLIIPFVVVIMGLSILGLLGNLFTIIVIVRNRNMRTTTNYYLLSLAVSDFLVFVLTSPVEIASIFQIYPWVFGEFLCWTRYYFIEACTYTTVLNITTFTVERYIAICHPIKAKTMIKKSRVTKMILLIWFVSFTIAIPAGTAFTVQVLVPAEPKLSLMCYYRTSADENMLDKFYIYSALVLFVIPMTLISILYSLIAKVLSRNEITDGHRNLSFKRRNGRLKSSFRIDAAVKTRKQVVKMLGIIALCFAICWFPFHIIRLMPNLNYHSWPKYLRIIYAKYLYHISLVLFYLSSAINPLLYNLMSRRFRAAFKKTLCPCWLEKQIKEYTNGHSMASRTTSL